MEYKTIGTVKLNIKNVYSIVIALLPVIMCFKVPVLNIGFSTLLICLFAPISIRHIRIGHNSYIKLAIIITFGYFFVRSYRSPFNMLLIGLVLLHIIGACNESINLELMRKTIEWIGFVFAFFVFAQTLLYYVFGVRSSLLLEQFLLDENKYYVAKHVSNSGLYRPSAFFLEPAHYSEYCCIALLSILFPSNGRKADLKKAIVVAAGCLLTTSGIGMALSVGLFGAYAVFAQRKKGTRIRYIILWILIGVAALAVLSRIPLFQTMFMRITGKVDGYNAIWGRTLNWDRYIGSMPPESKLLGYGYSSLPEGYMTGLMLVLYCFGYVGAALLLLVLLMYVIKGRNGFTVFLAIMYCSLMSVANLFGLISLTFWFVLLTSSISSGVTEHG